MDETAAIIELRRRLKGITQKELAAQSGLTAQYISDVLKGRRMIGPSLAKWLGFEAKLVKTKTGGTRD